ncbi:MAG: hydrogenase maturation protease [Xanthomonadales bacterium]|nr:hydrogenase maturation protease [Gammaproteobacteria bacterium]NNJ64109.1 hydrogenase maturation protease [Xanthomonadales bacterium]
MNEAPLIRPDALVFGIGNSGRADDGLGWSFLDRLAELGRFQGRVEYRYQLQVEDAALVAEAEQVVFVDAYRGDLPGGFHWRPCEPSADFQFSTHALPPRAVLSLCRDLYPRTPPADLLMIQGCAWDLQTGLTTAAEKHLEKALNSFLVGLQTTPRSDSERSRAF